MSCPLCRTKFNIPKGGLSQFLTNYFVSICKPEKYCKNCQRSDVIYICCGICGLLLCKKCFKTHRHLDRSTDESSDEEEEDRHQSRMPLQIQFANKQHNIQTNINCKLHTQFVVEIPVDNEDHHVISCLSPSKNGGMYVLSCDAPLIMKYDHNGHMIDGIRIPDKHKCYAVIEICDESLLAVFPDEKLILKYAFSGWSHFVTCIDFCPIDLVELSNGKILACGPDIWKPIYKRNISRRGHVHVYSMHGELLLKLNEISRECNTLEFPHKIAYNKKAGTIAVLDLETHSITILKVSDGNCIINKANISMVTMSVPFLEIEHQINFRPTGICSTDTGQFIVSTPEGCLHVIDEFGHLCCIGFTNCEDKFGRYKPNIALDENGVLWCSDSQFGTLKTFKITKYHNFFNSSN
ncbi:unnamed protein product [Mytilus coruscus]|uniref:B box-type domain-containing protein n=1 Tax=Mytilus coruscus TaxID=42192 RepID=A0A6J8ASZ9_MYTCO|nr:unnamed protein product [Mytilus coruscus]